MAGRPGAASGAAISVVAAGPVGVVVGGSLAAVASAMGGAAAGALANPADPGQADTVPDAPGVSAH